MRARATIAFLTLLGASVVVADGALTIAPEPSVRRASLQTVLAPDSTLYAIDSKPASQLAVSRRRAEERELLPVPGTDDDAVESQAQIVYDRLNDVLYVAWHRAAENVDEILLASVSPDGAWSDVQVLASGGDVQRAGLQLTLTRAREQGDDHDTTLMHAAWWSLGAEAAPEYAVIAFEGLQHLSTETASLEALAGAEMRIAEVEEEVGRAEHPPLVLARAGRTSAVDAVFGSDRTTGVTRVRIVSSRISGEARIWRPSGRSQQRTGPTRLIPNGSAPVQAFVAGDRIVLYAPDEKFRFVVQDGEQWMPVRTIGLDERLSGERLLEALRRSVEEDLKTAPTPDSE